MKEIQFEGTVRQLKVDEWRLVNKKEKLTEILIGIDEILDNRNMKILEEGEEIEIIIRLKNRQ
jgi:hypothetical protein